jgi:hypothetical protein
MGMGVRVPDARLMLVPSETDATAHSGPSHAEIDVSVDSYDLPATIMSMIGSLTRIQAL